jgi:hypothetical protein
VREEGDGESGGSREAAVATRPVGGRALSSRVLVARVWEGDPTAETVRTIAWRMTGGPV